MFFLWNVWSKPIPKPPQNPSAHFGPVSASLDHSQPILHRVYIFELLFEKKVTFVSICFEVFPIFSLFVELRRLWDHSQIVDLIFLIRMVSTRASETSKTPHSWQNNVPKRPKTFLEVCFKVFLFFIVSWALDALGPLPNCRSHFSDLDGINESSQNLQNTSFMTKQCSNPNPVFCVFPYNWCLVI